MGASGCGKSAVGARLAAQLGRPFLDGDDLHSPANVAKMAAGTPLSDDDRLPWLQAIRAWMSEQGAQGRSGVVACSALRRSYRDALRGPAGDVVLIHLDVPRTELERRLAGRREHFMPASLLDSQLEALEPLGQGEPGVRVAVDPQAAVEDTVLAVWEAMANSSVPGPPR